MKLINDVANGVVEKKHGFAPVNDLNMSHEIEGTKHGSSSRPAITTGCVSITWSR